MAERLCVDCRWFHDDSMSSARFGKCVHKTARNDRGDLVTGRVDDPADFSYAVSMRTRGACGVRGRLFEALSIEGTVVREPPLAIPAPGVPASTGFLARVFRRWGG